MQNWALFGPILRIPEVPSSFSHSAVVSRRPEAASFGGSRRPNQTCWYYTRFLFSGRMSDFCKNAYRTADHQDFIPVTICWKPAVYAERPLLNDLQWLSCFAERGAGSRCSHGCPRTKLAWNMGTFTRGLPRVLKGSTSEGTELYNKLF